MIEDKRILIGDIETLLSCIDLGFYDFVNDTWHEFQISRYKNELYSFIKFYNKENWDYVVWYNGIGFDTQIIQFIIEEHDKWFDFSGLEICDIIYRFTQQHIDNKNYGLFNPYSINSLEIKPIDVFTILGLDNEARRSSWTGV